MILDSRNRNAVVPKSGQPSEKDHPPPYTSNATEFGPPPARTNHSSNTLTTKPAPPPPSRSPAPRPSVNQVHLRTGPDPITGTFFIDPAIPSLGFNAKGYKARKKNPPHASFCTRQGEISLELATTGNFTAERPKASVLVSSRTGNIDVRVLSTSVERPRLGLELHSRRGNIVLFLPRTYAGAIQLNTRKGSIQFLPALASAMKVIKQSDNEALILLGDQSLSDTRVVDFCELQSRFGKLVIGITGMDKYESKAGFWKKIVMMFGGGE